MRLTIEQQRVFDDWIRQKIEHHVCQLCQSSRWKAGELINGNDLGSNNAMLQLICDNCGHVLLFNVNHIKQWHSVATTSELM